MELNSIKYSVENQVATIMISRPGRNNSWSPDVDREYRHMIGKAEADPDVRVIIMTGDPAGKAFCPGADTANLAANSKQGPSEHRRSDDVQTPGYGVRPEFDAPFAYHFGMTKPVIAAINGAVAGIGLTLTCFADMRFAVSGAKFTAAFSRLNLPAEYGISWVLPRIVGVTNAADILLSSRVFLAEEALAMGFLNKVLPADELIPHVREYAALLVEKNSPGSLRMIKQQIYADLHRPLNEAVAVSEKLINESRNHPDSREGISAWLEKRPAKWLRG